MDGRESSNSARRPPRRFSPDKIAADTLITDAYGWLSQSARTGWKRPYGSTNGHAYRLIRSADRSLSLARSAIVADIRSCIRLIAAGRVCLSMRINSEQRVSRGNFERRSGTSPGPSLICLIDTRCCDTMRPVVIAVNARPRR